VINGRQPRREDFPSSGVIPTITPESIPTTQPTAVSMYSSHAINGHRPPNIRLQNDAVLPSKKRRLEKEVRCIDFC